MIVGLEDVRAGYEESCDAVVVGSGPGGAVAAANLARAGMDVVVVEAGPAVGPADMVRDAPLFLARYFWEGGLRIIGGTTQSPSLQARCLGGSSVVNSAIMLPLPDWVREEWAYDTGLDWLQGRVLDAAYERIFRRSGVGPTPMTVMGRRNLAAKRALDAVGIRGRPLPRAVIDCEGASDCLTGCAGGRKQSVDRTYLADAVADGARVYTCSHVERIVTQGRRVVAVTGRTVDPRGRRAVGRFTVRAKRVVLAAGTMHTPVILQQSGIDYRRRVGATLFCHIGGGMVGILDEVVDPRVGATQGWGAISDEIRGLKFEGLWASPSVLMVRWGDVGLPFVERLHEVKHAAVIALVYRGNVHGSVRARRDGSPAMRLWIPETEVSPILRGMKQAADGLLAVGARYVHTGIPGVKDELRTAGDTASLLSTRIAARQLTMTMNHTFGSCRMSERESGPVDGQGRLKGVDGLYVVDASIFPSPSAVNPQATIMALADVHTRRLGELPLDAA